MRWKQRCCSVFEQYQMRVLIPDALRSYTQSGRAEARGATLVELLNDLEHQYPGIRFRMIDEQEKVRRHIRIFINGEQVQALSQALNATDEIVIVQALSGG
jgi:molybdopterin synthase sulfur carrier subunit